MLRTLVALAVFGLLFTQTMAKAAEKEDQFPRNSVWTGTGHAKDAKGVIYDRGGFTLTVTSHEGKQWAGTLVRASDAKGPGGKVEVEGTVNSTYRVTMAVTKVVQGAAPNGFMEAKFTGDIEDGKLSLSANHPSGAFIELTLTREAEKKQ
jgi:hypothetical protein